MSRDFNVYPSELLTLANISGSSIDPCGTPRQQRWISMRCVWTVGVVRLIYEFNLLVQSFFIDVLFERHIRRNIRMPSECRMNASVCQMNVQ